MTSLERLWSRIRRITVVEIEAIVILFLVIFTTVAYLNAVSHQPIVIVPAGAKLTVIQHRPLNFSFFLPYSGDWILKVNLTSDNDFVMVLTSRLNFTLGLPYPVLFVGMSSNVKSYVLPNLDTGRYVLMLGVTRGVSWATILTMRDLSIQLM